MLQNFKSELIEKELNKNLPYGNMRFFVREPIDRMRQVFSISAMLHVIKSRENKIVDVEFHHKKHKNLFWRFCFECGLIKAPKYKKVTFKKQFKLTPIFTNTHLSEGDIRLKQYIQHVAEYKLDKDIW